MVGPHGRSFSIDMVGHPHGGSSWWVFSIDMVGHSHEHKYRYGGSLS